MVAFADKVQGGLATPVEIDPQQRRVHLAGEPVSLGERAFDLLLVLAAQPGRPVAAAELVIAVWPDRVVEPGNLRVQINQLRSRLGPQCIVTLPGRGYCFNGTVKLVAPPLLHDAALVGREAELQALASLAGSCRLITVVGACGIGKTRLLQAWFDAQLASPQRWRAWVDLTPLADADSLLAALARVLALPPHAGRSVDSLLAALPPGEIRLVLDNAEHLASLLAALLPAWLARAPQLRLMVTSQVPLRLADEQVMRLGPLEMPEPDMPLAQVRSLGSVQLFERRVRSVQAGFELHEGNLRSVVALCRRLDGLPLAIELAAARVPSLGLELLAQSLDQRLQVLGSDQRCAPARQRTLQAALAWTVGLLDARSQRVFARLGVFAGNFSLADAQHVVADPPAEALVPAAAALDRVAVLDGMAQLVDASLVVVDPGPPLRYRLLESPRLYAWQCLIGQAEQALLQARHLAWCVRWLAGADAAQVVAGQRQLRAALEWALAGGNPAGGAQLAERLAEHPGFASLTRAAADAGEARDDTLPHLIARLREQGVIGPAEHAGLAHATLLSLAQRLRPDEVRSFDTAVRELERAVALAGQVLRGDDGDVGAPRLHDDLIGEALADAAEAIRLGQLDAGADRIDDALAELQRREERRAQALRASRQVLLQAGLQQDQLRRDAFAVARRQEALLANEGQVRPCWSEAWVRQAREHLAEGGQRGVRLSIRVAVEMARRRLLAAESVAERVQARRELAEALTVQGHRELDGAALQEALQVCQAALTDCSRAQTPLLWAALQHVMGEASLLLGQRNNDAALLAAARQRCEQALQERRRALDPDDWSASQDLLGEVLRITGMHDTDSLRLLAATEAFHDALSERSAARQPLLRGRTLGRLGVALCVLATRQAEIAPWHEAAAIQRQALGLVQRSDDPTAWAQLQGNHAIVLLYLGGLTGERQHWRDSIACLRRALTVDTRESHATAWARHQHNLAIVLAKLAEAECDAERMAEAVAAYRRVLLEHTRDRHTLARAAGKHELGTALMRLGWLCEGEAARSAIAEGCRMLEDAFTVRRRDQHPVDWAQSTGDLALAMLSQARLGGDAALGRQALATVGEALAVLHPESNAEAWRALRDSLGQIEAWLAAQRSAAL